MIKKILPTPVYSSSVNNKNIIEDEIAVFIKIIKDRFYKKFPENKHSHWASDITFAESIIEKCNMLTLSKEILRCAEEYKPSTPFVGKPCIVESWMVKYEKNDLSKIHHHPRNGISGCYYYKTTDSPGNGDFYFQDNWEKNHTIIPEEGQLVLFPSWLNHGVTINKTDKTRMCLAFNIIFE